MYLTADILYVLILRGATLKQTASVNETKFEHVFKSKYFCELGIRGDMEIMPLIPANTLTRLQGSAHTLLNQNLILSTYNTILL